MSFDGVLLSGILRFALAALTALLGVIVLLRGRRYPWLFSGAAAFLLAILAVRVVKLIFGINTDSVEGLLWEDVIPIGAAVLGALAATQGRRIAYALVGLASGGVLGFWLARIFLPPEVGLDFWSATAIVLLMLLGMLFVLRYGDVALILLSAGIGVRLIVEGLALPFDSALVSALGLAAAIASLVIQYHDYLVELRKAHRMAEETLAETSNAEPDEVDVAIVSTV